MKNWKKYKQNVRLTELMLKIGRRYVAGPFGEPGPRRGSLLPGARAPVGYGLSTRRRGWFKGEGIPPWGPR